MIQDTDLDTVEKLPHASIAVNVLVCVRLQPLLNTAPSLIITVGVLHASDAAADPSAAVIAPADGLHPSCIGIKLPTNAGGVRSVIHITVLGTDVD